MSISSSETQKFWEMFQQQSPVNGLVSGDKMLVLLKNSRMDDTKLAQIWELSDLDGDGSMDFDEFCISMRLVFDALQNGQSIPSALPESWVPAAKKHLWASKQPQQQQQQPQQQRQQSREDDDGLRSDFQWYISPEDRKSYEKVYNQNCDRLGYVGYESLNDLYKSLSIPATDISSAWNIVNPRSEEKIDKEQCMVYLHILNQRFNGSRVPRSVPATLRATFSKERPSYDVNSSQSEISKSQGQNADTNKPFSSFTGSNSNSNSNSSSNLGALPKKHESFAEGYLSRLGLGGRQAYQTQGTDFSATKDTDWEVVRLRKEIDECEAQLANGSSSSSNSSAAAEFQSLLEYKQKQLSNGNDLKEYREEITMIEEQLQALRQHHESRKDELKRLRMEIDAI